MSQKYHAMVTGSLLVVRRVCHTTRGIRKFFHFITAYLSATFSHCLPFFNTILGVVNLNLNVDVAQNLAIYSLLDCYDCVELKHRLAFCDTSL